MIITPLVKLTTDVGAIPAGEIFYIPEFKDGQVYCRPKSDIATL